MTKYRIATLIIIAAAALLAFFVYTSESSPNERFHFKLGLDLQGGVHLTYEADVSEVAPQDVEESMSALRDVIERRVNVFGVSEPIVQVEQGGIIGGDRSQRLIVELPGVTDVDEAIKQIGETPLLEFRLLSEEGLSGQVEDVEFATTSDATTTVPNVSVSDSYQATGLTGRHLQTASLQFDNVSGEPIVSLEFNDEGRQLFAEITRENVGNILAIFLDGVPISQPVIQDEIPDGQAVISGNFNPEEARDLVRNLRFGALPVPIELVSTQSIGPTLGARAVDAGVKAGVVGLALVALFMLVWYRVPGLISVIALAIYSTIMLALFKLIPVTLTSAGIAGFILSIGMAVDANVLIFERLKEEIKEGRPLKDAVETGFSRAWLSIRDSNLSTIITAIILYYATTSLVRGFALTLGLGVIISMLTAITVTRTLLLAVIPGTPSKNMRQLYGAGFSSVNPRKTSE